MKNLNILKNIDIKKATLSKDIDIRSVGYNILYSILHFTRAFLFHEISRICHLSLTSLQLPTE